MRAFMSVVLPMPLRPMIATISPSETDIEIEPMTSLCP